MLPAYAAIDRHGRWAESVVPHAAVGVEATAVVAAFSPFLVGWGLAFTVAQDEADAKPFFEFAAYGPTIGLLNHSV